MKNNSLAGSELRAEFEASRKAVVAEVDNVISRIDASSSAMALEDATKAIDISAELVETLSGQETAASLVAAAGCVRASSKRLAAITLEQAEITEKLAALPVIGDLQFILALFYVGAALTAFVTELILTKSLTFLLGFSSDDPTGRLMGATFASSLLVYELVFARLRIVTNPWPLFQRSGSEPEHGSGSTSTPRGRSHALRVTAGALLILALLGIAFLQGATIVKMAPTREIAGKLQEDRRARMQPIEEQEVKESVLFFSLCVLISGGFLAAAGTREMSLWLHHRDLERKRRKLTEEYKQRAERYNTNEKPILSAELAKVGLPFMWLLSVSAEDLLTELGKIQGAQGTASDSTAQSKESAFFAADKRIALANALNKIPVVSPRAYQSTLDIVTETISNASGNGIPMSNSGIPNQTCGLTLDRDSG